MLSDYELLKTATKLVYKYAVLTTLLFCFIYLYLFTPHYAENAVKIKVLLIVFFSLLATISTASEFRALGKWALPISPIINTGAMTTLYYVLSLLLLFLLFPLGYFGRYATIVILALSVINIVLITILYRIIIRVEEQYM